jgi:hypothetical protein
MFRVSRFAAAVRRLGPWALLCLLAGCQPPTPLSRAGVSLAPPASWRPAPTDRWPVPGTPLAAWAGPNGASLVVYRQIGPALAEPAEPAAQGMLTGLATRLSNLPGLNETARRIERWGDEPACRLEVVAPGTGDALAPTGIGTPVAPRGQTLIPTHRVMIGIPGPQTIFLVWHAPESAQAELLSEIETIRQGFRYRQVPVSTASY